MSPETRDLFKAQLVGLRATVGALQAQIVALEAIVAQEPDRQFILDDIQRDIENLKGRGACPHTETENVGTFGAPQYQCQACHEIVTD